MDQRYEIHFHHVGGYAGSLPVAIPRPLRRDVNLYLYDANAESMDRIEATTEYRRQLNIGKAVFDRDGEIDVHLTYHPAASSLFPMSPAMTYWADSYIESDMCDIRQADLREVRSVRVPCTTIDALIQAKDISVDFLSLDAEGSEGRILDGARVALATSIVGLISEVHFIEVRVGQTTAGELFERATRSGFHLADLRMHEGRGLARLPLGWRTAGAATSGDAFFFKRLDAIRANYPAPAAALAKLALFCLLLGRLEHGVAAALAAWDADDNVFAASPDFAYLKLLDELVALHRQQETFFLPTWSDFYPTAEAGLRHGDAGRGVDARDACRRYFSTVPPMKFLQHIGMLSNQGDTPLEALVRRYDMDELAASVKQRRQRSLLILLKWLDLIETDGPTSQETIARRVMDRLA